MVITLEATTALVGDDFPYLPCIALRVIGQSKNKIDMVKSELLRIKLPPPTLFINGQLLSCLPYQKYENAQALTRPPAPWPPFQHLCNSHPMRRVAVFSNLLNLYTVCRSNGSAGQALTDRCTYTQTGPILYPQWLMRVGMKQKWKLWQLILKIYEVNFEVVPMIHLFWIRHLLMIIKNYDYSIVLFSSM